MRDILKHLRVDIRLRFDIVTLELKQLHYRCRQIFVLEPALFADAVSQNIAVSAGADREPRGHAACAAGPAVNTVAEIDQNIVIHVIVGVIAVSDDLSRNILISVHIVPEPEIDILRIDTVADTFSHALSHCFPVVVPDVF